MFLISMKGIQEAQKLSIPSYHTNGAQSMEKQIKFP